MPPLPGEEALYAWIGSVLDAAANDPEIKNTLKETATQVESEMITPFLQWRLNGRAAGNGWNSPVNNAEWGTDYLNRTGTAKSNMYDNRPEETKYIYTDDDSQGQQLNGQNSYAITFAKGEVPPVNGFWSLTLYDAEHFFNPNPLNRYSLGTKNKSADALCWQQIARQGQGKQLVAGTRGSLLALHPRLLGGEAGVRWAVEAARRCSRAVDAANPANPGSGVFRNNRLGSVDLDQRCETEVRANYEAAKPASCCIGS